MTKPLKESPQKDGLETKYDCGLHITGGWGTRLAKYKDFINSPMGKYILELEHANNKAEEMAIGFGKWLTNSGSIKSHLIENAFEEYKQSLK